MGVRTYVPMYTQLYIQLYIQPHFLDETGTISTTPHPRFDPPGVGRCRSHLTADLTPVPSAGSLVRMGAQLSPLPYPADQPAQCPTNAVNA